MMGRGRGRGHRLMNFSVESIGINRGDSLPPSIQQPTPAFPAMEHKPLPLTGGEEAEYLLALKQEFRGAMKILPSFIQPAAAHRDVERYSDKYHGGEKTDGPTDWTPDWKRFPKELRVHLKKPVRHSTPEAVSRSDGVQSAQKKKEKEKVEEKEEVMLKLETLEKKEEERGSSGEEEEEGEEKKKKQEEEEVEGEEEYDEEELEEETDYIMSYFDNGEDFGGESDDNMDEAIY